MRICQEIFFYQIAAPVCQSRTCTGELRLVPLPVALSATMSKDEEPFTGFNKRELHGTLVGNWVEERQLESDTGVFRYKVRLPATPRGIIILIIPFWPLPRRGSPHPDPIPSPSRRAGSPLPASTTPRRRARSSASPRRRTSAWSSTHPPCRPANGPPPRSPSLTTRTRARGTSTSARRWAPGTARSWLSWRRRR